jgi:hypothetical protein
VLEYFKGRRAAALQALGISYPTLLKRLREIDLERSASEQIVKKPPS